METSRYAKRTSNESHCLELIMNNQDLSRADLANITGLTKATISTIVKKLIEDQLVLESGIGESSNVGGRKPIILEYNGKAGLSISLEVGYNYINALLSYLDGEEISIFQQKPIVLNKETFESYFLDILKSFKKEMPVTPYGIIGIAIAIHGPVYNEDILFTPHYSEHIPFREIAEEHCEIPVFIENEANLSALGEYSFASNSSSLISVSMHSGIGAGIVHNGILQTGSHGFAGEIGHQVIQIDGRKCGCGNCGCLEMYAANKVCFDKFAKIKSMDYVNAIILREYYQNQDPAAIEVVQENVRYLSIGVNNLFVHYDPEVIVINSSLYREIPDMIEQLTKNMEHRFSNTVIIRNTLLNEKATLLGGLILNLQNLLEVNHIKFN